MLGGRDIINYHPVHTILQFGQYTLQVVIKLASQHKKKMAQHFFFWN